MKEKGWQVGAQGMISTLGVNGAAGMMIFGTQKWLSGIDPTLKFWLFWAGIAISAFAVTWLVFKVMFNKKVNKMIVGGVAAMGLMITVLMSPLMPLFFPFNPVELSMSGGLEAGIMDDSIFIVPILTAVVALIIGFVIGRRK